MRTSLKNKDWRSISLGCLKTTLLPLFKHVKTKHKIFILKSSVTYLEKIRYSRIEKYNKVGNPMNMFNGRWNKIE